MTVAAADLTRAYLEGFAQLLHDKTEWAWDASGNYDGTVPAISTWGMVTTPDRLIALYATTINADPRYSSRQMRLQLRFRGAPDDPRTMWTLRDTASYWLLGNYPLLLATGVRVNVIDFDSGADTGQEQGGQGRFTWSDTYRTTITDIRR